MTLFGKRAQSFCISMARRAASPSAGRYILKACLVGAAAVAASAPGAAAADITSDRVDFFMYGRMGIAWTLSGQVIAGKNMNLGDKRALGGRLEESDYLEPGLKFHLLKGEKPADTTIDVVTSFEMFATDGSYVSDLANGDIAQLKILPEQAYVEAQNVFTEGLTIWGGSRLYRGTDIHIADYFYFNNLPGEGIGVKYKGLDAAVLVKTSASPFHKTEIDADLNGDGNRDVVQRQRTMFIAQYSLPFGPGSTFVQGLGELHLVPKSGNQDVLAPKHVNPRDAGWVVGAKLHLDLNNGAFNDASVRFGARIANGAAGGGSTFDTFGAAAEDGTYKDAYGIEVADHFLWNFDKILTLNAYGALNYSKGSLDYTPAAPAVAAPDSRLHFAVGVRPVLYAHDKFHLATEASFQGRKDEGLDMGTAFKVSVVPTIVPTGERTFWARPHLRLIYTAGFYNQAAVDQLMSPYLKTVGPTKVAHYLGTRAEWWF
jgi:maltoporin